MGKSALLKTDKLLGAHQINCLLSHAYVELAASIPHIITARNFKSLHRKHSISNSSLSTDMDVSISTSAMIFLSAVASFL